MFLTADTFHRECIHGAVWSVTSENEVNSCVFLDTEDEDFFIGYPWDTTDSFILF